jgi:hypothetical protein
MEGGLLAWAIPQEEHFKGFVLFRSSQAFAFSGLIVLNPPDFAP